MTPCFAPALRVHLGRSVLFHATSIRGLCGFAIACKRVNNAVRQSIKEGKARQVHWRAKVKNNKVLDIMIARDTPWQPMKNWRIYSQLCLSVCPFHCGSIYLLKPGTAREASRRAYKCFVQSLAINAPMSHKTNYQVLISILTGCVLAALPTKIDVRCWCELVLHCASAWWCCAFGPTFG